MKTLITDHGFANIDIEREVIEGSGFELALAQCKSPGEVIAAGRDADALLVQWAPVDRAVIESLSRCKIIVRYGIGYDNIDLQAAAERDIPVCNVPDYCIEEVADHTLAHALALARQLPQTDRTVRSGIWKITPPGLLPAFRDTVFATAGFGRIARAVLERARAFGFQLAAYDPFVSPAIFADANVRRLDREELLREAGILSLHLPLTPETKHFLNRQTLETMLRTAIIVNTARGGLIDTSALAEALNAGTVAGAGIDVFEDEPLPDDHALRQSPNTLLTSHTAWYSAGSVPQLQRKAAEEIVRGLRGEKLSNVVNGVTGPTIHT